MLRKVRGNVSQLPVNFTRRNNSKTVRPPQPVPGLRLTDLGFEEPKESLSPAGATGVPRAESFGKFDGVKARPVGTEPTVGRVGH